MDKIKVKRQINATVEYNRLLVGDVIHFTMKNGEEVEAVAVKKTDKGMLFCFVDCLKEEHEMNNANTNRDGYKKSDLRKALNSEVILNFPDEIRNHMVGFDDMEGDLLRIPTEREIFGDNIFGVDDDAEQWKMMKYTKNRIALQGLNGIYEYYWLQNEIENSAALFCRVGGAGNANAGFASGAAGVRPVFLLS